MPVYPHYIGVGPTGNPRLNEVSSAGMMQAPHGPLKDYYAEEADRPDWVRGIFDDTAGDYDRVERVMIAWPSGRTEEFQNLAAGRCYECTEGKGISPLDGY